MDYEARLLFPLKLWRGLFLTLMDDEARLLFPLKLWRGLSLTLMDDEARLFPGVSHLEAPPLSLSLHP